MGLKPLVKFMLAVKWVKVQMVDCPMRSAQRVKNCFLQASSSSWLWQQTWW